MAIASHIPEAITSQASGSQPDTHSLCHWGMYEGIPASSQAHAPCPLTAGTDEWVGETGVIDTPP